jgi:hypothetical protein
VSLKTPSKNPVGKKEWRKEYKSAAACIAFVASLKPLYEKFHKNSV